MASAAASMTAGVTRMTPWALSRYATRFVCRGSHTFGVLATTSSRLYVALCHPLSLPPLANLRCFGRYFFIDFRTKRAHVIVPLLFYKHDFFLAEAPGVSLAGWAWARSTQFWSVFLTSF